MLSILIGCAGCILLSIGNYSYAIIGAIVVNIAALGDYIDGNVARCTETSSKYGYFLDTMNGYLMTSLLPVGIAIGLFNNPDLVLITITSYLFELIIGGITFLVLGFSAALFFAFGLLISNRFAIVFSLSTPSDYYKAKRGPWASIYAIGMALLNPVGVLIPLLVLAAAFRLLSIFLVVWFLLAFASLIVVMVRTFTRWEQNESFD